MSIHRNPYFLIHLCVLTVSLCLIFWLPLWRKQAFVARDLLTDVRNATTGVPMPATSDERKIVFQSVDGKDAQVGAKSD